MIPVNTIEVVPLSLKKAGMNTVKVGERASDAFLDLHWDQHDLIFSVHIPHLPPHTLDSQQVM